MLSLLGHNVMTQSKLPKTHLVNIIKAYKELSNITTISDLTMYTDLFYDCVSQRKQLLIIIISFKSKFKIYCRHLEYYYSYICDIVNTDVLNLHLFLVSKYYQLIAYDCFKRTIETFYFIYETATIILD